MRWRSVLALVFAFTVLSACGGGGDDEPNPVALVAALFAEQPDDLPDGVEQTEDIEIGGSLYGEDAIANTVILYESDAVAHDTYIDIYRDEDAARASLEENADDIEVDVPEEDGETSCTWDDEFFESLCIARRGPVYIELSSYSQSFDDEGPEQDEIEGEQAELFDAIDAHIERLIEDAPDEFAPLPRKPLAALLTAAPPAPAPDGADLTKAFDIESDELLAEFEESISFGWQTEDEAWRATFSVMNDQEEAESYRDRWIGDGATTDIDDPEGTCVRTRESDDEPIRWWVCLGVSDEVLVFARHEDDGEDLDDDAADFLQDLLAHIESLRAGELPPATAAGGDDDDRTPEATSAPATPTPQPTATPDPGPPAVNAGTWTFTVTVDSNTCPGGVPAPGSAIELQYEFTEAGADGLLSPGEFFGIEQTLPGYRDFGVFQLTLPVLRLELPVTAGEFSGTGRLTIEFLTVDTAHVLYTEDYGSCLIEADSGH